MRSIPLALAWETYRRGGILLVGFLGANAITVFLMSALRMEMQLNPIQPELLAMHVALVQLNMFIFGATVLHAQGWISRLYTHPIRNEALAGWHMLYAMILMASQVALSTYLLNTIFGLQWPILGPALFAAAGMAAAQAISWLAGKTMWLFAAVAVVGTALCLWHNSRYGGIFSPPTRLWNDVTGLEFAFLSCVVAASYCVGVMGIARGRCGEPPFSFGFFEWLGRVLDSKYDETRSFKSPADAQFWFFWERRGLLLPGMTVAGIIVTLGIWGSFVRNPEDLVKACVVGGGALSLLAVVSGLAFGNIGTKEGSFDVGHFLGTRPITTSDMSNTILKAGALSTLVTWSIWAGVFAIALAILFLTGNLPDPLLPEGVQWWYFPATLLGCWTALALCIAGGLLGDLRWFGFVYAGVMLTGLTLSVVAKFFLTPAALSLLQDSVLSIAGIAMVLGTMWVFARAYLFSYVSGLVLCASMVAWLVLTGIVVYEWRSHPVTTFPTYLFVIGLLAASQAPFAAAPLALAFNRNQ